jgi:hypothetical protein
MVVVMTTSYACRAVTRVAEVSTIPAVMHTEVLSASGTEVVSVSVVVTTSAMDVPSMSTTVGCIEVRTSEVEEVTMWIYAIYSKVPISCLPIKWTIEI